MSERICPDCETSIAHLHYRAKRCKHCVWLIKIDYTRNYHKKQRIIAQEKKKLEPRLCLCCNKCIAHMHYRTKYCEKCIKKRKLRRDLDRYHREKNLSLKKRICLDCETCITNRHGGAKRCKECAPIAKEKRRQERKKHIKIEEKSRNCPNCGVCITGLNPRCILCRKCKKEKYRKIVNVRCKRYREDPKYRAMEAAATRRRMKKLKSTPEGREKKRASNRKYYLKKISTLEGRLELAAKSKLNRDKSYSSTVRTHYKGKYKEQDEKCNSKLPSRQQFFDFQCGMCPLTGISMQGIPLNELHIDHTIPISTGGSSVADNLCLTFACANISKGNKPLLVWMSSPLYQPIVERCFLESKEQIKISKNLRKLSKKRGFEI